MTLPLALDIALGLIFIFLTLSLLASEIQELIATVLQWRAEHLKRSIENLVLGNEKNDPIYHGFVDELYSSPLIKALNQEAKGIFPRFFRDIVHGLGVAVRTMTGAKETFAGQQTGPSYIPAPAFADALLQKLGIEGLAQHTSELTLKQFCRDRLALVERILHSLRHSLGDDSLLTVEADGLRRQLIEITQNFKGNRISLSTALEQAIAQLAQFLDNTEAYLDHNNLNHDIIRTRLPFVRQSVLQLKLEPTIYEVLALVIKEDSEVPEELTEIISELRQRLRFIPPELRGNMLSLAEQAQLKVSNLTDGVRQLHIEIETWFNRSMDRASGVYRRNARGFAILLGILTAILTNSDTFLMVERLSQDSSVRTAITQTTDQLVAQQLQNGRFSHAPQSAPPMGQNGNFTGPEGEPIDSMSAAEGGSATASELKADLNTIREAVGGVLEDIPLPIGWNSENLSRQVPADGNRLLDIPKLLLGWLVTGVAISMGSNFWFDLLGKVIRVRNTGSPTKPSSSD